MELDPRDRSFQKEFPTVMVPRYGKLEPCPERKVRLLMGRNGLYLETRQKWAHLVTKLWQAPRDLPFGDVDEVDTFKDVLVNLKGTSIMDEIVLSAAGHAREGKEWMGWIIFDPDSNGFRYQPLLFKGEEYSVNYDARKRGHVVVMDIHSHHTMRPFFSDDDDDDDSGGVRICVVIGNFREARGAAKFDFACRYCVEGFKISPEPANLDDLEVV